MASLRDEKNFKFAIFGAPHGQGADLF